MSPIAPQNTRSSIASWLQPCQPRRLRQRISPQAMAKPTRYISPYQRICSGPISMATGSMSGKGSMARVV